MLGVEPHLEHDLGLAAVDAAAPSRLQHIDAMGGAVLRRRADLERHRRSPLDAGPAAGRGDEVDSACYSAKQTTCASAGGRNRGRQSRRCRRLGEQRPQALRDGSVESSGEGEELEDAVTEGREGAPPQVPASSSTRCHCCCHRHRHRRGHCRCRGRLERRRGGR